MLPQDVFPNGPNLSAWLGENAEWMVNEDVLLCNFERSISQFIVQLHGAAAAELSKNLTLSTVRESNMKRRQSAS